MPKPPTPHSSQVLPDPALEKRTRRIFTADYKLRIVREADACEHGEIGPLLLRREKLYSNQLSQWRWDSAEHLKTEEDIQFYLEACLEEAGDDPAFILQAFNVIARARNMSQLSRDTGISREGLYKALFPDGNPTFSTVAKVAKALGFRISVEPLTPAS